MQAKCVYRSIELTFYNTTEKYQTKYNSKQLQKKITIDKN